MQKFDFRTRVPALDGLRGIAILAVFFYHYARGASTHTDSAIVRAMSVLFGFGWSGVDLFFVLSGFLITGILFDTLSDPQYFKAFYARRVLRIFPIYYLVVIIFIILTPILGLHWKAAHLFFLVYLGYPAALIFPDLVGVSSMVAISHLWSLSLEEQFYMVWPWFIAKLGSSRNILRACAIVGAVAFLFRLMIHSSGVNVTWSYTFLLCRMDSLAAGAAIAILIRGSRRERVQSWAPIAFIVAGAATIAICVARGTVDHDDPVMATIGFSVLAVMNGALLILALRRNSWLERLLSLGILRTFGKYSYGLYLYHFPLTVVLAPMKAQFVAWAHSFVLGASLSLAFNLIVNLSVAIVSFHLIESPIMRWKSRFSYTSKLAA